MGDGVLSGVATATGTGFSVVLFGQPTDAIPYTLDPGEDFSFSVRFLPTTTGARAGSVILTGGGGATVPLTGDTP